MFLLIRFFLIQKTGYRNVCHKSFWAWCCNFFTVHFCKQIHFFIDDTDKKQIKDKNKVAANTSGSNDVQIELDNEEEDDEHFLDARQTLGESQSVHPFKQHNDNYIYNNLKKKL